MVRDIFLENRDLLNHKGSSLFESMTNALQVKMLVAQEVLLFLKHLFAGTSYVIYASNDPVSIRGFRSHR